MTDDTPQRLRIGELIPMDQLFLEVRYAPSLLFQDYIGTIAHICQSAFEEVTLSPGGEIVAGPDEDEIRVRVSPVRAWFASELGSGLSDLLELVTPFGERVLKEFLKIEKFHRVGLRSYSILPIGSVDEAVECFKAVVCDYYAPPFDAFPGKPSTVKLELGTAGWSTLDGMDVDARLTVAPIHLDLSQRAGFEDIWNVGGGVMFDLDTYFREEQEIPSDRGFAAASALYEESSQTVINLSEPFARYNSGLRKRA